MAVTKKLNTINDAKQVGDANAQPNDVDIIQRQFQQQMKDLNQRIDLMMRRAPNNMDLNYADFNDGMAYDPNNPVININ